MKLAIGYLSSEVTTVMINKIKRFNFIIIIYYYPFQKSCHGGFLKKI